MDKKLQSMLTKEVKEVLTNVFLSTDKLTYLFARIYTKNNELSPKERFMLADIKFSKFLVKDELGKLEGLVVSKDRLYIRTSGWLSNLTVTYYEGSNELLLGTRKLFNSQKYESTLGKILLSERTSAELDSIVLNKRPLYVEEQI